MTSRRLTSRLKFLATFLLGALTALAFAATCVITAEPKRPEPAGVREGALEVLDTPAPSVPIYLQTDERWGGLPYAGAELSDSGCGLTCAAMAWSYFSGKDWTPVEMLNAVGNDCVQEGQNYMPGFCQWMSEQDHTINYSVIYEDMGRALKGLEGGSLVFGEMQGQLEENGRDFGGHIVLLTKADGHNVTIHDPCSAYALSLSYEQMERVDWGYFITIGRQDGSARH